MLDQGMAMHNDTQYIRMVFLILRYLSVLILPISYIIDGNRSNITGLDDVNIMTGNL